MFIETICINKGELLNIEAHAARMHSTARHHGFVAPSIPNLIELAPRDLADKKVRCTITYGNKIMDIRFIEYIPRTITSLKLVESNIEYSHKFSDREELNNLLLHKENCDEILIIKNNCITDTTFSNVVFKNNNGLFTPDTYLLNGTKRQLLINKGIVTERRITINDLYLYNELFLVNAMLDLEDIRIDIKNLLYN